MSMSWACILFSSFFGLAPYAHASRASSRRAPSMERCGCARMTVRTFIYAHGARNRGPGGTPGASASAPGKYITRTPRRRSPFQHRAPTVEPYSNIAPRLVALPPRVASHGTACADPAQSGVRAMYVSSEQPLLAPGSRRRANPCLPRATSYHLHLKHDESSLQASPQGSRTFFTLPPALR